MPETTQPRTTTTSAMHLTVDPWWGLIEVLAFGTVCDLIGADRYEVLVPDHLALVLDPGGTEVAGFVLRDYADFDPLEHEGIWDGPRFDVPVLGLAGASVGEVLLAIRGRFAEGEPTADAMHFHQALDEPDEARALGSWQLALEAGDMKAHYSIGYTLCALGEHRRAYDHLRFCTELAPRNAWAWCWLGQACEGAERPSEARAAYERAVAIDPDETDAAERLELL